MDESARQLSLLIENVTKMLAEDAVYRHAQADPTMPNRFGTRWRTMWVDDVRTRVKYLAQAIALQEPALFAHAVNWSRQSFAARGMTDDDLQLSLQSLAEALQEQLPASTWQEIAAYVNGADPPTSDPPAEPSPFVAPDQPHAAVALGYVEALLDGRRTDAETIVMQALERGVTPADIYQHVLAPAQQEIGRMWHLNEVTVADEHFATATTESLMARIRAHAAPRERHGRRLVATSVGGDLHAIGVRMVADFFEMDGWDVRYLGSDLPTEDLIAMLMDRPADLLAVSCTSPLRLRSLGELITRIRAQDELARLPIIVGGSAFSDLPDLWRTLGADGCAASAPQAVELGNRLTTSS